MAEQMVCPYCKVPTEYYVEVEKTRGRRRITRYYRCPVCGAKIIDEIIEVEETSEGVVVRVLTNGVKKIVGGRPRRAPRNARRPKPRPKTVA